MTQEQPANPQVLAISNWNLTLAFSCNDGHGSGPLSTQITLDGRWTGDDPSADRIIAGDMASMLLMLCVSGRMVRPSDKDELRTAFEERVTQSAN